MVVYVVVANRTMGVFAYPSLARQWCYERGAKDTDDWDTLVMPDGTLAYLTDEIPH